MIVAISVFGGLILIAGIIGWVLYFRLKNKTSKRKKNTKKRVRDWRTLVWVVAYFAETILSTIFVILHWGKCLDISFFDRFNGYNIIWFLWLFLLFIPLIKVDNQWFKVVNPFAQKEKQYDEAKEKQNFSGFQADVNKLLQQTDERTKGDDK